MNRRIKLLLSSAIVACVAGTTASAQTTGSNMIEELVVTAQKREESLQDVPVAVSAFTDETRDIVSAAPDVILVMSKGLESVGGIDGLLDLPGVAQTPAGRDRRVIAVEDGLLLSFGPRTDAVVQSLREGIGTA